MVATLPVDGSMSSSSRSLRDAHGGRRAALVLGLSLVLCATLACGREEDAGPPGVGDAEPVQDDASPDGASAAAEPAFVRRSWLEADSFEHDFGEVYPQTLQRAVFDCVAAGEEPLVVRELKYSCGCTAGELLVLDAAGAESPIALGEPYPSGTRLRLRATLNTKGRTGEQEQKLTVVHGDGSLDLFTMKAAIEPFLVAEPATLSLEDVSPFEGARASFELRARNGERFTPTLWRKILGETLEVSLAPLDAGDTGGDTGGVDEDGRAERWRVDLHLLPGRGGETLRAKLIWTADVVNVEAAPEDDGTPALQRLEVLVLAEVAPVVSAWPDQLNLGRVAEGAPVEKQVVLHSDDPDIDFSKAELRLVDARGEGPLSFAELCELRAEPRESSAELGISLALRSPSGRGAFAGRIVVDLHHPLQERLEIPFRGVLSN